MPVWTDDEMSNDDGLGRLKGNFCSVPTDSKPRETPNTQIFQPSMGILPRCVLNYGSILSMSVHVVIRVLRFEDKIMLPTLKLMHLAYGKDA